MTASTLHVTLLRKDPEITGHVLQLPLSLLIEAVDVGNSGELVSTGCKR